MLIFQDAEALARLDAEAIRALTEAATKATFHRDELTAEQIAANRRVVEISAPTCIAAASADRQMLAAAIVDGRFAGFVVATAHSPDDRELDWLMVEPTYHGSNVAAGLMQAGMNWLGTDRPMWLNVISYNDRAIRFYRRFGFEIDAASPIDRTVPHVIMRRIPDASRNRNGRTR